jgi:hypothetical protein
LIKAIAAILIFSATAFAADGELSFESLDDGTFRSYAEVGHKFDFNIRPMVSIETNMDQWTGQGFHPADVVYTAGVEYYWKDLVFTVYHLCAHPVDRFDDVRQYNAFKVSYIFGKK